MENNSFEKVPEYNLSIFPSIEIISALFYSSCSSKVFLFIFSLFYSTPVFSIPFSPTILSSFPSSFLVRSSLLSTFFLFLVLSLTHMSSQAPQSSTRTDDFGIRDC